jgi:endonuclease/exonuclease/phosphatase family metal-dependent hydrolase
MKKPLLISTLLLALSVACFAGSNDTLPPGGTQVSIMSYNIKMLPRGANSFLKHFPVKRAKLIPAKLIETAPDVIVFQEAFDGVAIRAIKKRLKKVYPYTAGFDNRKVISYKRAGGVLMFSKYPMKELESIRYSECKGIDCMGNKGAMLVEVSHPAGTIQVLGTHMQAGGGKELKKSQYAEAGELLRRHEKQGVPQFAAGDFNTHLDDSTLYVPLLTSLRCVNGDITGDCLYTSDHLLNDMDSYDPNRRKVIDFVFYKGNGVTPISTRRYVKAFEQPWSKKHKSLSDHNAIVLEMKLPAAGVSTN